MRKGLFIVFEGLDGSNISKRAEELVTWFKSKGIITHLTSEPTKNLIGGVIRAGINNEWKTDPTTLQLLFSADRTHHINTKIKPALDRGDVVVSDRYFFSSLAFGSVKGVDKDWLRKINSHVLLPDMVFFIDIHPKECLSNLNTNLVGQELFNEEKKLMEVRNVFLDLASDYENYYIIDGSNQDLARARIISIVENYLKDKKPSLQVMLKFES